MKVHIRQIGWQRAPVGEEWKAPHGYHMYLCTAANGIVCVQYEYADEEVIPEGDYDLPDSEWGWDSARWDNEDVEGFPA